MTSANAVRKEVFPGNSHEVRGLISLRNSAQEYRTLCTSGRTKEGSDNTRLDTDHKTNKQGVQTFGWEGPCLNNMHRYIYISSKILQYAAAENMVENADRKTTWQHG